MYKWVELPSVRNDNHKIHNRPKSGCFIWKNVLVKCQVHFAGFLVICIQLKTSDLKITFWLGRTADVYCVKACDFADVFLLFLAAGNVHASMFCQKLSPWKVSLSPVLSSEKKPRRPFQEKMTCFLLSCPLLTLTVLSQRCHCLTVTVCGVTLGVTVLCVCAAVRSVGLLLQNYRSSLNIVLMWNILLVLVFF